MKKIALQKVKRRKRKNFLSLIPGVIFLLGSLTFIYRYSPDDLIRYERLSIPVLPVFIILFAISVFFIASFIKDRLQGLILSSLFLIYSVLSFLKLNSVFFLVLIISLLIVVELFIYKKSDIRS